MDENDCWAVRLGLLVAPSPILPLAPSQLRPLGGQIPQEQGKGYADFTDFAHRNGFKNRFQEDGFIETEILSNVVYEGL